LFHDFPTGRDNDDSTNEEFEDHVEQEHGEETNEDAVDTTLFIFSASYDTVSDFD
jgi:hypothetical protein